MQYHLGADLFQVFHLEVRIAYLKQYPKPSFSQLVQAQIAASKREQVAVARPPAAVKPRKADAVLGLSLIHISEPTRPY